MVNPSVLAQDGRIKNPSYGNRLNVDTKFANVPIPTAKRHLDEFAEDAEKAEISDSQRADHYRTSPTGLEAPPWIAPGG
jgi:hypothetical protein